MLKKRGQSATEYLIIIGFVTFAVLGTLAIAYIYSGIIKDKIKVNQIETLADKIISSAESVYYAGEPSKTTVSIFVPKGAEDITVMRSEIIITFSTSAGTNVRSFTSSVPLEGSISATEGTKKITLTAQEDSVLIS